MRKLLAALLASTLATSAAHAQRIPSTDLFVPWTSTAPVDAGQVVGIHVRHKTAGKPSRVVLFVHGATGPSEPDFDLDFKDYNWMEFMVRAGFDAYAIDLSGYGSSPRPMLDDPCNASAEQQKAILINHPLEQACAPSYPHAITTIRQEWQEIDAVVDAIRKATGKARIDIIGWSAGGPRVGGYVSANPQKIDRVVLYAPSAPNPDLTIPDKPDDGAPLFLQTRDSLMNGRWQQNVRCPGQVEDGVRDAVWQSTMDWDRIGRSWGGPEGVMRSPTLKDFGWRPEQAAQVTAPTLVIGGEFDIPEQRKRAYDSLGAKQKVYVRVACASHFMVWERQHMLLQRAALEWLSKGSVHGVRSGELQADAEGRYSPLH